MEKRHILPKKNPKNGSYPTCSIERRRLRIVHDYPNIDLSGRDFNWSNLNSCQYFAGVLIILLFAFLILGSIFL